MTLTGMPFYIIFRRDGSCRSVIAVWGGSSRSWSRLETKLGNTPQIPTLYSCHAAGFYPILLGEVISSIKEADRWRMLLQLAVCARMNALLTRSTSSSPPIIQGVYVSKDFIAERYLAYAEIPVSGDFADCQTSRYLLYGRLHARGKQRSISVVIIFLSKPRTAPQIFFGLCTTLRDWLAR